jgi:uncharacterized membrane protein
MATEASLRSPRASRGERNAIIAITATFGLLLTLWALVTPMFHAPDEAAHFDSAVHLAIGDGWAAPGHEKYLDATAVAQTSVGKVPATKRPTYGQLLSEHPDIHPYVNQMTQHPPTYYAVAAVVLKAVHFESLRWDVDVMVLRMLNVLMVAPLPLLAWASVRRLTRSPKLAIVASVTLFAVPELAQIGSSVTNDAPVMLVGALLVWLVVRMFTGATRWPNMLAISVLLGLIVALKATGLPAIPFVAVAVLFCGREQWSFARRCLRTLAVLAIAAVLGAWWWAHNLLAYHTLQPNGLISVRPNVPWPAGATANFGVFFNTEWNGLTSTFWGGFGRAQFAMAPFVTDALSVVAVAAIVIWAYRRRSDLALLVSLTVLPVALIGFQLLNNWQGYERTQAIDGVQGRYFYPGIIAMIILSAVAWRRAVITPVGRRRVGTAFSTAALAIAIYGISVMYRGFYEEFHLTITMKGLDRLFAETPFGAACVWIVCGLVLAGLVVSWFVARRITRAGEVAVPVADDNRQAVAA